jgi:hypothetical protein
MEGYDSDKEPAAVGKDAPDDMEPRDQPVQAQSQTDRDLQAVDAAGSHFNIALEAAMVGSFIAAFPLHGKAVVRPQRKQHRPMHLRQIL